MTDSPLTQRHTAADMYLKSMFYEQLVEHVFVSEVLQECWYRFGETVEVLRSEIDSAGYDIVLECRGIVRHIQLKTSRASGKAQNRNVNVALAGKPSGCVVWIVRQEDPQACRMSLSYLFFGAEPGQPLPSLDGFKVARHPKADMQGVKKRRNAIRLVPKSRFTAIATTGELVGKLFGLHESSSTGSRPASN